MNKDIIVQLFTTLLLSNDNTIRNKADEEIQKLNKQSGFSLILLDIFSDQSIDIAVRNTVIVVFKNLVKNNWRNKENNLFSNQEKSIYRDKILLLLNNPNEKCENGIDILTGIIGIIARVDYPQNWPNLLTNLLELFEKSTSEKIKITSLKTIKSVVQQLASRRFVIDRDFFNKFSNDIFKYFIQIWQDGVKRLIGLLIQGGDFIQYQSFCTIVYYVSKILRRVVEYGFTDYQNTPEICQYFSDIFTIIPEFIKIRTTITNLEILKLIDKFIYVNQKTIIKSQNQNPLSFINLLLPSLKFFSNQCLVYNPHEDIKYEWNTTEEIQSIMTQSVNFLKQVIDCTSYQSDYLDPDNDKKDTISNSALASAKSNTPIAIAQKTIASFFNHQLLSELLKALVSNYLIINKDEIERWEDSPEEYIQELQVEDSIYELKPSAYNLFILLMRHFHQDSVSIVVSMLEYVTSSSFNVLNNAPQNMTTQQICLKEACYMTIGLGYHDLMDRVNFSQVFTSIFVNELSCQDPRFKIIKRRILWLVSYWVGKIPIEYKDSLIKILLEFSKNQDLVISLTAVDALKAYIDDYEFDSNAYQPYLQNTLESLIQLFSRSTNETTKSNLLSALGSVFIQFNESIKPFSLLVVELFQHLWNNGQEEPIVKSAVLRTFAFFLQALNSDPSDFFSLLLPIINFSISDQESKVYLLEDGLELWYQTMVRVPQNCLANQPALVQLFKNWINIMTQSLENCEVCFKILDTYLLLGKIDLLGIYGSELSNLLHDVIYDIGEDHTELVVKALMRIIQVVPNSQDSVILIEKCLFKVLSLVISGKEDNTVAVVEYLSLFSRILTMNPLSFFQLLDRYPLELLDKDGEYSSDKVMPKNKFELYNQFFDLYFDKVDSTGDSDQRKLIAIGLCNLLTVPREEVYQQIGQIITVVVGIRGDIPESSVIEPIDYCNDGTKLSLETSGVQLECDKIAKTDPLNTVNLSTYLYQKIQECSNVFGVDNFQKAIQSVHPSVLELAKPI